MARDFTTRKRVILGAVIFLVAADLALGAYSWQLASASRTPDREYSKQEKKLQELQADLARAQRIRSETPKTQQDCQKFEDSLLPASSGSSSLSAELGEITRKSGVHLQDESFKPTPVPERGLTEVAMDVTIEGDYKNVILFLNGLQRSANNYEVGSLSLATGGVNKGPANVIKVSLHLKTYFRTSA